MNNDDKFNYSYLAPTELERREIESIKRQYSDAPKYRSELDELRALNKRVYRLPTAIAVVIGILGALIMGTGMAMTLEWNIMPWGVIVGVLGIAVAAVAYPIYRALLKSGKSKYGQRIVELSDKLLNNDGKL